MATEASAKAHQAAEQIPSHIWFRCDASSTIGLGHLQRCLSLGLSLQQNHGAHCHYLVGPAVAGTDWDVIRSTVLPPFSLHELSSHLTLETEPPYLLHYFSQVPCDVLLVDLFEATETYLQSVRDAHFPIVVIDDFAALSSYPCDAIVNHHLQAKTLLYRTLPETRLCLGPQFALLRPEFLQHRAARQREYPKVAAKVLVTMGGADPQRTTYKVLTAIGEMDESVQGELEICVVLGAAYGSAEEIRLRAQSLPHCEVVQSPRNLVSLMDTTDVAITAAGGTLLELACLGVPSLIIAITPTQQAIAETWAAQDSAIYLGVWNKTSTHDIASTLQSVVLSQKVRTQLGQHAMQLVDGSGANRIATFIQEELISTHGTHGECGARRGSGTSASNPNCSS